MTKVEFTILGKPFGKQRKVQTRWKTFFPKETENYRALTQYIYQAEYPDTYLQGPLFSTIKAYFPIPKSMPKYKQKLIPEKKIWPLVSPDNDNVEKMVWDSLNKKAYPDDKQIVGNLTWKYYSERPRVEVMLEELE